MKILSNIKLEQIMSTNIISVRSDISVHCLLIDYFNTFMKSAFPVLDVSGQFVGLVTLKNCLDVPESKRNTTFVKDIMIKREKITLLSIKDTAEKGLNMMVNKKQDKIFVGDLDNKIIGVVSKSDIIEAMDKNKSILHNKDKRIGF